MFRLIVGGLVFMFLSALLALWVARPFAPPDALRVHRIEIVDHAGQSRISLGLAPDGMPRMRFYDSRGVSRLVVAVTDDGVGIAFSDSRGQERGIVGAGPDVAFLKLRDGAGEPRARIYVDSMGVSHLDLVDARGDSYFSAP